jgi:hypothetical protein
MSKIGIDPPFADLVGVCQVVARNRRTNTHVIDALLSAQASFDILKTLAIGQLGEGNAKALVETGKLLDLEVSDRRTDERRAAEDAPSFKRK